MDFEIVGEKSKRKGKQNVKEPKNQKQKQKQIFGRQYFTNAVMYFTIFLYGKNDQID